MMGNEGVSDATREGRMMGGKEVSKLVQTLARPTAT